MGFTFDGATKVIQLTSGTVLLDVVDLYSRWKDWVQTADNSKWATAFTSVGGDNIDLSAGTKIPAYIFLDNGWRIRPQAASHTLSVTNGIILVSGGGDPFLDTIGSFVVRILYQQPVQAITAAGGNPWTTELEGSYTAGDILRILAAVAAGKTDIAVGGSTVVTFRDVNDTHDAVVATMTGSERTTVVLTP